MSERPAGERRLLRDVLVLASLFVLAYAITYIVMRPGPIVAEAHALPRVLEQPIDSAERELQRLGFKPRRAEARMHPSRSAGTVTWQDPPAGTVLPAGSIVTLTASAGVSQLFVPDVEQFPVRLARQVIEAAGLSVNGVDSLQSPLPRGTVLETRPAAGSGLPAGGGVTLVVSTATRPTWTRTLPR